MASEGDGGVREMGIEGDGEGERWGVVDVGEETDDNQQKTAGYDHTKEGRQDNLTKNIIQQSIFISYYEVK